MFQFEILAILNLKEAVKVTDELMPVCAQDKGKEEDMTNCQTVHIAPNIDDPTGKIVPSFPDPSPIHPHSNQNISF